MRPIFRLGLAAAVTASAGRVAVMAWPIGQPLQALDIQGDVNRGAYLARASGCIACHTDFAKGGATSFGTRRLLFFSRAFVPAIPSSQVASGCGR